MSEPVSSQEHPVTLQQTPIDLFPLSRRQLASPATPIPSSSAGGSVETHLSSHTAQAAPTTTTLEPATSRKVSTGGASVLARVKALEAQQQERGKDGAEGVQTRLVVGGATFRRTRSGLEETGEVGLAVSGDGASGGAGSSATLTSVPTRPQPTPSASAPILPSSSHISGLVAKRRSWIELADRPPSDVLSPAQTASRPTSTYTNDPISPLSVASSTSRSSSPTRRSLSSAALAAVADTPPRVARPPLPPKSAARLSRASSRMSAYSDELSPGLPEDARSRSNSVASSAAASRPASSAAGHGSLRKVPSLSIAGSTPPTGDDKPLSPLSASPITAPSDTLGLTHPRPRPRLTTTASNSSTGRTPALSVAGSTSSSRPSSGAFSPFFAPPAGQHAFSYPASSSYEYSTNYSERNSFFSNASAHGHDADESTTAMEEWATPATTADFSPAPSSVAAGAKVEDSPDMSVAEGGGAKAPKKRGSKQPPPALQLEPTSLAPPSLATLAREEAEIEGLGISYEQPLPSALALPLTAASTSGRPSFDGEGDFQSNLDRLSLFAASLPSPYPPALALALPTPVTEAPPVPSPFARRERAGTGTSEDRLSVPSASNGGARVLGLGPPPTSQPQDDRTLVLPSSTSSSRPPSLADEPLPHPPPPPFAREPRAPRQREVSAASSIAASSIRSASSSGRPSLLNLPRTKPSYASLRGGGGAGAPTDSEAYFSGPDETDFLSTDDDEDSSFNFLRRANDGRRFLGFSEFGGRNSGSGSGGESASGGGGAGGFSGFSSAHQSQIGGFGSPDTSFATTAGGTTRTSFASSAGGGTRSGLQRESSAGSGLWNEDVPAMPFLPPGMNGGVGLGLGGAGGGDGSGLQFVMNAPEEDVVDWSGKGIEKKEMPAETTHLILSRCTTPFQIAPLLTVTVPLLTHGLVVLDIAHCGLSEVPSAIAQCCFLEELDLTGNPLATGTLPSFLGTLPSLNVLLADNCNLSSLPNSLAQLSRLRALHLRNNKLRMLPSWLCRLSALEALLVDGNPFHWQIHHLVRPLFVEGAVKPAEEAGIDSAPPTRAVTPAPSTVPPSRSMSPLPPAALRSPPLTVPPGLSPSPYASPVVEDTISPPIGSPAFFRSTSATPIYQKFSTPPPASPVPALAPVDLDQVQRELEKAKQESEAVQLASFALASPALSPPALSPLAIGTPPLSAASAVTTFGGAGEGKEGGGKEKKKWTKKLMKKVSGARMRSGSTASTRPGQLDPDARTYSAPITRAEESEAEEKTSSRFGSFGRKKKSSSKSRTGLALHGERAAPLPHKRRSFLLLDSFPSPRSATPRDLPSPTHQHEHDHKAALRSVLAYLRDLDDLSPDVTLPTIPLEASTPRLRHSPSLESTSPSLRHSPSLGAIGVNSRSFSSSAASVSAMRRAQSTRRLPSNSSSPRPDSSRLSAYYDDEAGADGRSPTPLAASAPSSKLADEPGKREAVLKEIVETEQTYLRGLEEVCGIYVASASVPLSTAGTGKKDTVLPAAERRAVFSNIEAIRDFHRKILLPDLLAAVRGGGESIEVAGKVGEVFMQHASFLKIYSSYINGFDDALARIQTWAKTTSSSRPGTAMGNSPALGSLTSFDATAGINSSLSSSQKKRIKSWLKRCKGHPSHSQISLESYLLLPIQRIPRYRLLLESLSACTPSASSLTASPALLDPSAITNSPAVSLASSLRLEPHPTLVQAVQEMDAVAVILNESKRENEGRAQLLIWQNRITQKFKSSLVQPHRALLRTGNLTLVRSVKRSTTTVEPPLPNLYRKPSNTDESELFTLFQENKQVELIALLCTDLLVLCKAPPAPLDQDPNSPIELYTVLRLSSSSGILGGGASKGEPPVSLMPTDGMLRIRVGDKAIIYVQCGGRDAPRSRKAAVDWQNAINLQWEMNG